MVVYKEASPIRPTVFSHLDLGFSITELRELNFHILQAHQSMTFCYSSLNRLKQHLNPQKRNKREKKRKGHREEKAIGTGLLNKNLSSQKEKGSREGMPAPGHTNRAMCAQ